MTSAASTPATTLDPCATAEAADLGARHSQAPAVCSDAPSRRVAHPSQRPVAWTCLPKRSAEVSIPGAPFVLVAHEPSKRRDHGHDDDQRCNRRRNDDNVLAHSSPQRSVRATHDPDTPWSAADRAAGLPCRLRRDRWLIKPLHLAAVDGDPGRPATVAECGSRLFTTFTVILPALDAVLDEVLAEPPDAVVLGGDVAAGPMPAETLDRLLDLTIRIYAIQGNADRELLDPPSGDDVWSQRARWAASKLTPAHRALLAAPPLLSLTIDGLGPTLFCHGSPRSDEEIITRLSPERRITTDAPRRRERVIVCGHTHVQFDREVACVTDRQCR